MINQNTLFGIFAILLWSFTVAISRSISESIGPFACGASVYLTAGVILAIYEFRHKQTIKRFQSLPRMYFFCCGTLFIVCNLAIIVGLGIAKNRCQTIEVGLFNYLWPSLTIIFSVLILSKRATFWLIPATVIGFTGVFLVLTQGASISFQIFFKNLLDNPAAYGLGLLAAISWALYSNLARRLGGEKSDEGVAFFMIATGLCFLIVSFFSPHAFIFYQRTVVEIGVLGLFTAIAYVFWDTAMRKGDVVLIAACSYMTPLLSTLVSYFYLHVIPSINLLSGCLLIIGGSFLSWYSVADRKV